MLTEQEKYDIVDHALLMCDEASALKYIEEACGGDEEITNQVLLLYQMASRFRDEEEPVRVGETLGNYKLISELGAGLLARVYMASHNIINNYAAIKVFKKSAISIEGKRCGGVIRLYYHA